VLLQQILDVRLRFFENGERFALRCVVFLMRFLQFGPGGSPRRAEPPGSMVECGDTRVKESGDAIHSSIKTELV
jgi:hypothetical protein